MGKVINLPILLDNIKDIKKFISVTKLIPQKIFILQDGYVVNAKSEMALYSLDLQRKLALSVPVDVNESFMALLNQFIVK